MELQAIFDKPVDRPIEGVIKADDDASLYTESSEYVLTNEVAKHLEAFLDAYTDYHNANGAWISGFFGSGKSHLLKMLALLLEDRAIDGKTALDLFLPKIHDDDELLRAKLKKAAAIPSRSILFNIDQKADIISKSDVDALLSVFVKVFNEACGYYGKQGYIAQFERDLDSRGQLDAFKQAYEKHAGKPWERGREQAVLESANTAGAYADITGEAPADVKGILSQYRSQYSVSIEDFGNQVKAWLDEQPAHYRLNFFVDEVGQYIADNTKLMTNLQTVAESLATKCAGRAWLIVTAQEDMNEVLGDASKQQSNDFSKIQARFKNRLKLTSADVAEVIQKRLLAKTDDGRRLLQDIYAKQANNFKTLFDFPDGGQGYRNFRDEEHFVFSYPFVPYQFPLFQAAIRGLSLHNGFEGQANSVGERSMLGVFQDVAKAIQHEPVGQLATFDQMFEGIRGALKSAIQSAINTAEHHLGDDYAIRVLKALFLVKYVKEFKATARNLGVLLLERFDQDIAAQRKQLQAALDKLEHQIYIQRTGDTYEFLTDEEKDIEKEIKNTEVETSDLAKSLEELLFDGVIRQRKIRYGNGEDYAYTRKLDGQSYSREMELAIHIITPLSDGFDNLQVQRMQSMGQDELRVALPTDARFMQDVTLQKRTEKYIRQNSNTQRESVRLILEAKGAQNSLRQAELRERANELLGNATLIINARDIDVPGSDGQPHIVKGFHELIEAVYPNLRMLRGQEFNEADIGKWLKLSDDSLTGTDSTNLTEPEQELLSHIQTNARAGQRTTVKQLLERFARKSYGWPYAAILCHLALLCARGKVEVRQDSNTLAGDELERSLRNTHAHASLVLEPQTQYTASQIRALKDFFADFFDHPPHSNESRALARETVEALRELEAKLAKLHAQKSQYPFLASLGGVMASLTDMAGKNPDWFFHELANVQDTLLDTKNDLIDPACKFMQGPQKTIYDDARILMHDQEDNLTYLTDTDTAPIKTLLASKRPWQGNQLQQVKSQLPTIREALATKLAAEKVAANQCIDALERRLQQADMYAKLSGEQRRALAKPFSDIRDDVATHRRIAMVRDGVRSFEDVRYPQLLVELDLYTRPAPARAPSDDASASDGRATPAPAVAERKIVPARDIRIAYAQPWLSSEAELDDYLAKQREAWLKEIQAGNRVQV